MIANFSYLCQSSFSSMDDDEPGLSENYGEISLTVGMFWMIIAKRDCFVFLCSFLSFYYSNRNWGRLGCRNMKNAFHGVRELNCRILEDHMKMCWKVLDLNHFPKWVFWSYVIKIRIVGSGLGTFQHIFHIYEFDRNSNNIILIYTKT